MMVVKGGILMRVLLLNDFALNGQATHVFALGRELKRQGLNPHLLLPELPEEYSGKYHDYLDYLGFHILATEDRRQIEEMMEKVKFDVIHAHSPLTYPLAYKLSNQYKVPYVLSCHGLGIEGERYKKSLAGAHHMICISHRVAGSLADYRHKISVIPNGIDTAEYTPGKKTLPVKILYAGRVDQYKRKGFMAFEKSLQLCHASSLPFEYYCASNVSSTYKGGKSLGWVPSIAPYANNTDIIVGTGRALLEGMSAGNAACILGRMWGGIVTPESTAGPKYADLSGMSGKETCYRTIFFDLAKLIKNMRLLRNIQQFSRNYVVSQYNIGDLTQKIVDLYGRATIPS
jgi:alpha-maltose-1-phosphate synthase